MTHEDKLKRYLESLPTFEGLCIRHFFEYQHDNGCKMCEKGSSEAIKDETLNNILKEVANSYQNN